MRQALFLSVCFTLGVLRGASGEPLSMRLEVQDLIVGEYKSWISDRFQLVIVNDSATPIRLATQASGPFLLKSRYWKVEVSGPTAQGCGGVEINEQSSLFAKYDHIEIPAHGEFRRVLNIDGVGAPGHYVVRVIYDGKGAPQDTQTPEATAARVVVKPLFEGRIVSTEASFDIKQPTGVDAQIIQAWRQVRPDAPWCQFPEGLGSPAWDQFLLREYPTSTYAAYVVAGATGTSASVLEPFEYLQGVERGNLPISNGVPDETALEWKRKSLTGSEMARWRQKWVPLVLTHHPDIWFADEFRLALALDHLGLKNSKAAAAQFEELMADSTGRVQERAKEYLALMIEKGMIQRSDLSSAVAEKLQPAPKNAPPAQK